MPMVNLNIGFSMADGEDPAGMCVLYQDEKGESHIQNMVLGEKAELIYRLLTTPSADYDIWNYESKSEIRLQFRR